MQTLIDLFMQHQVIGTAAFGAIWNAFVGSLDAPTKDSGPFYKFAFKFCNTVAFNFQRASSTSIENSPNFKDAVERYLAAQAQGETVLPPKT
jgi:hypothetical protein